MGVQLTDKQIDTWVEADPPWMWAVTSQTTGQSVCLEGVFTQSWYQGRGVYGGVLAALGMRAMQLIEPERSPRSFTLHCLNPAQIGKGMVKAELISRGGRVSHLRALLWAGDTVIGHATATFATARKSGLTQTPEAPPQVPVPQDVPEFPAHIPMVPEFTRQLSYRYCLGSLPYAHAPEAILGGWCDFRAGFPIDFPMISALLDIWPPAMFACLKSPIPAASVDFSYHFLCPDLSTIKRPFLYQGKVLSIVDGYAEERNWLWDAEGTAIAVARQLVALG